MDPVPTAFLPASSDAKNLNILHQTRLYAASNRAYQGLRNNIFKYWY